MGSKNNGKLYINFYSDEKTGKSSLTYKPNGPSGPYYIAPCSDSGEAVFIRGSWVKERKNGAPGYFIEGSEDWMRNTKVKKLGVMGSDGKRRIVPSSDQKEITLLELKEYIDKSNKSYTAKKYAKVKAGLNQSVEDDICDADFDELEA